MGNLVNTKTNKEYECHCICRKNVIHFEPLRTLPLAFYL